jgi:hypothetical protein
MFLEQILKRDVVLIPEHHCNFGNELRPDRPVKTVGFCGYPQGLMVSEESLRQALKPYGLSLLCKYDFSGAEDVAKFYRDIDIQVCFRPDCVHLALETVMPMLKNPLKLANAGSFGIPTVSYPEISYMDEFGGAFKAVCHAQEIVPAIVELANEKQYYADLSEAALETSKAYHIDNIVKLYEELRK